MFALNEEFMVKKWRDAKYLYIQRPDEKITQLQIVLDNLKTKE